MLLFQQYFLDVYFKLALLVLFLFIVFICSFISVIIFIFIISGIFPGVIGNIMRKILDPFH